MKKGREWTREEIDKNEAEYKAFTVPIDITIEGKQKILTFKQVEKILREADKISVENCPCRDRIKGCDAPLDVCVNLDREAEDAVKEKRGRFATVEEALAALRRGHEAGLVHLGYTFRGDEKPIYICSCCSCCCYSFSAMTKFGYNDAIISSDMIASQDDSKCDDCGLCVDWCKFGARRMDNETLIFNKEKCAGCGLCATTCESGAISLVERKKPAQ